MATITYAVTVVGGVYYIDGVSKPTLSFSKGNTYVFDVSDSSVTGHPLRFKDSSGSAYSTGVTVTGTAGNTGAQVEIVVGASTPSFLRYYCTVHGNGMGNTISVAFDAAYSAVYGSGEFVKAEYGVASALKVLTGVSATGTIEAVQIDGFEIDISERLDSVSSTGQIGSVTVTGVGLTTLSGVSATGSAGSVEAALGKVIPSVSAAGAVGSPQVDTAAGLVGVSATFVINDSGLDIRSINRVDVGSVSSTASAGSVGVGASEALGSVFATGQITAVNPTTFTVSSVSATGLIGSLVENVIEDLSSVSSTGSIGSLTTTAVVTSFVASAYSRNRTVKLQPRASTPASRRAA